MTVTWSSPAHEAIGRLIRARAGLVFHPSRVAEAEAGIQRAMGRATVADVSSYLQRLEGSAADFDELVGELAVTETYFFREPGHFDFLRARVLPDLLQSSPRDRIIRVWSAGCASGEEAYSLAILFEEMGFGDRVRVLATDISRRALARAREASYGAWSFRGVDPARVELYFRNAGKKQVLRGGIRERVHVQQLNLALDTFPSFSNGTWHQNFILCRNVFLYFEPALVASIARRFAQCLAPGGWLITGPSDPPIHEGELYESVVTPQGVFYRRGPTPTGSLQDAPSSAMSPAPTSSSPPPSAPVALDPLADASAAFHRGDYTLAAGLAASLPDAGAAALAVRALANARGTGAAQRAASEAAMRHPLVPELHLLCAVLWFDMDRYDDADRAVRRALYLDRKLAFGHFLLGLVLTRLGDPAGSGRAFHNARDLCARLRRDEIVPFSDGQRVGPFLEAVTTQLDLLGSVGPT
ncbi:MAG: CheR family methyltransferase [Polyangiaceae bacterium]